MKKITLLIAFFLAIVTGSYGQSASTYDFASSVGTYTQTSAAATLLPTVRADTSISTAQNIGFTFVYEGANYTQFKMGSNGFISLNATGTATLGTNNFSTANATSRPIIAPLWDDLDGATPASSVAAYELTGTAPNRVLTVEWRNWEWNWNSATPVISFQAKLYETTNVIEFVYRQEATAVASGSASIGIGSATGSGAGSFLNLTDVITPAVSSLTANTTISVKPITGRIFSFTPASCFKPGGITASAVTQTTATVSWNATVPAPATGYEYVVSTSNVAPAGAGTATTNLSEPVIGLAASTTYYIFVRSNCGAGFSSWNGPVAFTTLCNAVAVPWTENFDALTAGTNVFPSCWAYANTTENWYISTTNPVANSGANSLRRTWSTNGWAFSPMTTLVAGTSYTFSYYVRTNDNVVGYDITIGTGTGQTAGDMTNTLSAVTGYQGPTWTKVTHEFTPTISGDYSFGIHVVAPNAPNGINFDDFKLEETPSCLDPTVLTATNITATSADLSWIENGSATSWNVEWGATPFTQGTGTLASGVTNPYNLTGLLGNTTYQYYVQADCGGSGTSTWAGPYSFKTLCNAFPAPYTEAFENAGTIPSCWSMSGGEIWRFANTGTGNHIGNNGVITGATTSGGYFAWVDDSTPDFSDVTLTSPLIDASTLTSPRLTFFELSNNEGNQNSTLTVEVWDGAAWNNVAVYNTNTVGGWEKKVVSLSALTITGNIQVRFIYSGDTTGFYDDIAIDDVTIEESPLCIEPSLLAATNLTATSSDLSWTENGSATSWNVEWGATPFTQGTGTLASGLTNPYNLTGLSGNTTYQYYVQADCGGSGTSAWVGPYSFTTPCTAIAVPWTENFDALTTGVNVFPSCWAYTNTLKTWEVSNLQVANSGANSLRRTWSTDGWAFTPLTTLVAGTSYRFSYYVRTNDNVVGYDITIGTGTGQTAVDMTNTLSAVTGYQGPTWTKVNHEFTPTISGDYSFGVHVVAGGAPNGINFDDFTLEESPSCLEPSLLTATNMTASSADLSWTENGSATSWNVEWGATPFTQGTGTLASGVTNPYNLTGLSANTTYQYYVQADCGGSGTSVWAGPYSFTTPCTAISVPWTENFDALIAGTNVFPSCWAYANTTENWYISTTNPVANSGANSLRRTWSTNGWAFSPMTTLVAGTSYTFSYYVRTNDNVVGYDITIGTGTGQSAGDMTNTLSAVTGYQGPTWTKVTHEFTPTISGDYSFGLHVVAPNAPNGINFDDFVLEETPSCIAPIATASNITPTSVDITWPATSGNYEYVLDSVVTNPAGVGTVLVVETYNTALLSPLTTYYFHVRTDCGASSFSTWTTISFTTLATPPVNDDCSAPIALTPGGVFADQDIDTTNMGGTLSIETPSPTCGTFGFATKGIDVWYSVVVPASGTLTIETDVTTAGTGLLLDTVTQIYSGTCGALVAVACDDSLGNISSPAGADYSRVSLTAQTPGATLLVRAFGYNGTQGNFSISAYDASLSTRSFDATGFSAYPNPVKDVLNLSYTTPISSVSVHNLLGQEVMTKSINATQSKIDMSNLSNGTYLVKVTVDGLVKTLKVVKQ